MPQIRFYKIESLQERPLQICSIVADLYAKGHRVLIQTADLQEANELSHHLWSFRPETFIPHAIWPCRARLHPVILTPLPIPCLPGEVLLYASPPSVLPSVLPASLIIDFADPYDPKKRETDRERFSFWRKTGTSPEYITESTRERVNGNPVPPSPSR